MTPPERIDWDRPEPLRPAVAWLIDKLARLLLDLEVVHPERLPASGPVLVAANHVSFLDPPTLYVVAHRLGRRARFVALSTLFEVPIIGWLLRRGKMIAVTRGSGSAGLIDQARAALGAGQAVFIYPEGTIPARGVLVPARPGAGLLALCSSAPVTPVATSGLERWRPKWRLRRPAVVAIGEPVDLTPWRGRTDRRAQLEASAALLDAVRALSLEAERALEART